MTRHAARALRCLCVAVVVVGVAATARAQERAKWPLHVAIGVGMVLQGIDACETEYLAGAGRVTEVNPVFAPFIHRPVAAGVFKFSIATGASGTLLTTHPRAPRAALAVAIVQDVFYAWVVAHNARVLRATTGMGSR